MRSSRSVVVGWLRRVLPLIAVVLTTAAQVECSLADGRKYGLATASHPLDAMVTLSIGAEVYGGHVEHCLSRGAWVPSEQSRMLTTAQFEFLDVSRVVAGERTTDAAANVLLGKWDVPSSAWGVERRRPYASYVKPVRPGDDGRKTANLVLLSCTVDDHYRLTVSVSPLNVSLPDDNDDAASSSLLPLISTATRTVVFEGPIDQQTLHDDAVAQHIQMADVHAATEGPRRHSSIARLSFEQLVLLLWRSLEDSDDSARSLPHPPHRLHSDDEQREHTAVVRSAVIDGIKILVDTAGVHQSEQFWVHLETSLRRRIAFDDDDESGYTEEL